MTIINSPLSNTIVCYLQEKCAINCMEKYLKMNQRISQRFQEYQMVANEQALALAQKTGQVPANL